MSNQVMDFYNNDSSRPFEMSFGQNGKTVGTMRFNGDVMTFEGDADPSASVFIDMIVKKQSAQWEEATSRISELEAKCAALAAKGMELAAEAAVIYGKYNETQMPDRDLVDMQTIQEMHDLCSGVKNADAFLAEVRAQGVDECVR